MAETERIAQTLDTQAIELLAYDLRSLRERGGRLFCIGLGGGAANASHAANDFRKLCGIDTYCPTDNVAEFSARANDEGLYSVFSGYLTVCALTSKDAVMTFSVGGGTHNVSGSIVNALDGAKEKGAKIFGIVGSDGGHTRKLADRVVLVPTPPSRITPHTEAFQLVVLHCLVSHPALQKNPTKW
jgi:D-sedoheptulose 7-phosphate isomerase